MGYQNKEIWYRQGVEKATDQHRQDIHLNLTQAGCCFSTNSCNHVHVIRPRFAQCVPPETTIYTPGHTIKTTSPRQGYLSFTFGIEWVR